MNKYFQTITNTRGDSLPNYRAQVVDSTGTIVSIYADSSGTVFTDAAGNTVNYATADATGKVQFYWTAAEGQDLQVLDVGGDLVDATTDFADNLVLGTLAGEVAQAQVTDLVTDLSTITTDVAAKVATASLGAAGGSALVGLATGGTLDDVARAFITPEQFGVVGDGVTDDTVNMNLAVQAAIDNNATLLLSKPVYLCNILVDGPVVIEGNNCALKPAADEPVITRNLVSGGAGTTGRTVIRNLQISYSGISTAWTSADGIFINGQDGSEDYIVLDNIICRESPGYGLYALSGDTTSGESVQRLQVRSCTFVDSASANVRLEGVVLEAQFIGCFFNDGCKLGANPVITDQTTHSASPARDFRRGSVEILRYYTAADTSTNDYTPNRIAFIGCNFATTEVAAAQGANRTAGCYASGGQSLSFIGCNFEKPYPAIWLAREVGAGSNFNSSSVGCKIDNCTFLLLSVDVNLPYQPIRNDGWRGVEMGINYFKGSGGPTVDALITIEHGSTELHGPFFPGNTVISGVTVSSSVVGYTGAGPIKYSATAYSQTALMTGSVPNCYTACWGGKFSIIGKGGAGHTLDALATNRSSGSPDFGFMHGQRTQLQCNTAINGSLTVTHNATNGGTPINGRFILAGNASALIDADWKFIDLEFDGNNKVWREVSRNFDRVLSGSKTFDWASLASATQQSTTVTVTGAAVGDTVVVSHSTSLGGTRIWGEVTSANTVTVYQRNDTGGAVDVTSGTLKAVVTKA